MRFSTSLNSDAIVKHFLDKYPVIRPITVEHCEKVDEERLKDPTVYAHVHHRHRVLCISSEIEQLKFGHKIGILLIQIGKYMTGRGDYKGMEKATLWIFKNIGVELETRDGLPYVKRNRVGL